MQIQNSKTKNKLKSQIAKEFVGVDPCVDPINGFK